MATKSRLCAIRGLLVKLAIAEHRPLPHPPVCEDDASRLVEVTRVWRGRTTALRAEVCLWHSLIAVEQLGGRLIGVLDQELTST